MISKYVIVFFSIIIGFYGKNNMDMLRCDYIADCFYEIMHDYMRYFHEKNGRFRVSHLFRFYSTFHIYNFKILSFEIRL